MIKKIEFRKIPKKKIVLSTMAGILVLVILEIWALNRLATYGEQILKFEKASNELKLENQILQNQIAQKSSLNKVEDQSFSLGFRPIHHIEYLGSSDVALNH